MPVLPPLDKLSDHRILLVNDDGIHARGMQVLEEAARSISDDVWVVAPDEERSGVSHSVSLTSPLRVRQLDERHFGVKGSPADCVLMAFYELLAERAPSVVLSGINHGENLAEDMLYSGTAGAATEGAVLGARAIALSQVYKLGGAPRFDTAQRYTAGLLRQLLSAPWPAGHFVNINFPDAAPDAVTGVRLTRQGWRRPGSFRPFSGIDGRRQRYWWIKIDYDVGDLAPGTDLQAVHENAVSVTPMQLDLSAPAFSRALAPLFGDLSA